jgi:hypothetical protein
MRTILVSLLSVTSLVRADLNPSQWEWRRPLAVTEANQVHSVTLDRAVYANSLPGLGDLRVVRGGSEIPYVLDTASRSVDERELRPEILDRSVAREGLMLTLALPRAERHNRLRITTALKGFRIPVRIETSEDGRRWAAAREDGYIFDFSEGESGASSLMVEYPVSTRRYLRATFFGWTGLDAVSSAWLTYCQERPAVWQTLAAAVPSRSEDGKATLLTFDLGAAVPHSRLRIESSDAAFQRACQILTSANGKDWAYVSAGVVYRFPDEAPAALEFPERHDRYLRLRILNGDDRPIQVSRAEFQTLLRRVRFLADSTGEYALLCGNPKANAPSYDLSVILSRRAPAPDVALAAGAARRNPGYKPPEKPWSERHPELLWTTLAIAVLSMGYVTVRFLQKVIQAQPK